VSQTVLVNYLVKIGRLKSPRVIEAFSKINRRDFLPDELEELAYFDQSLNVGDHKRIPQPQLVARMIELLQPELGDAVLEVSMGCGWTAAVLGELVGPAGRVLGLVSDREILGKASRALSMANMDWVEIDQLNQLPPLDGFDRILISNVAAELDWRNAKSPSTAVVLAEGELHRISKHEDGSLSRLRVDAYSGY
jgi:protein-L-isoaspartate(D-aspartate) O-methyltransferase